MALSGGVDSARVAEKIWFWERSGVDGARVAEKNVVVGTFGG
ncbi:hypothetical protein ABE288_14660 [Bacillus salipaludis]